MHTNMYVKKSLSIAKKCKHKKVHARTSLIHIQMKQNTKFLTRAKL